MMRSYSLRRRIAALVAGSVFTVVVMVGAAAWLFSRHYLLNQTDANLIAVARSASATRSLTQVSPGPTSLQATDAAPLSLPVQLIPTSGTAEIRGGRIPIPYGTADRAVAAAGPGSARHVLRSFTYDGRPYRAVTVPFDTGVALQVAQTIGPEEESLHKLALLLLFVGAVGAAVAAFIGVFIARTGLRPVRELTAAAERVAATDDLDEPIRLSATESTEDEVARLAAAFNDMLAALAMSRDRQRTLIADAGHELRTPLTSLRTNIELLAREDPANGRVLASDDRQRLLADLTAQTSELSSLIGDLTDLAREDPVPADPEEIDLADVAERAVERVRRRATGVTVVTDLHGSVVRGHPAQLERALTNVLDNAVKWSPRGGEVFVGLRDGELVVADQGPGIADEDLPHVFERFYRATTSREKPGSGLGLAIVAQAARDHGGAVAAERLAQGGTLMRLSIPLVGAEIPLDVTPQPVGFH